MPTNEFKILGSEDPITTSLGNMTQGIGFPLRPVEPSGPGQPLIVGVEEVLAADDITDQQIVADDTPQGVTFGASQNPSNGLVSLDGASGTITFLQSFACTVRIRLQVARTSNAGVAWIVFGTFYNGIRVGNALVAQIDDNDFAIPLTFEGSFEAQANDTIQFQMYRDSQESTAGDAGLFAFSTTLWGDTSSARVTISRVVSQEP